MLQRVLYTYIYKFFLDLIKWYRTLNIYTIRSFTNMMISQSVRCWIMVLTNMTLESLGHIRKTLQFISCCICIMYIYIS